MASQKKASQKQPAPSTSQRRLVIVAPPTFVWDHPLEDWINLVARTEQSASLLVEANR